MPRTPKRKHTASFQDSVAQSIRRGLTGLVCIQFEFIASLIDLGGQALHQARRDESVELNAESQSNGKQGEHCRRESGGLFKVGQMASRDAGQLCQFCLCEGSSLIPLPQSPDVQGKRTVCLRLRC